MHETCLSAPKRYRHKQQIEPFVPTGRWRRTCVSEASLALLKEVADIMFVPWSAFYSVLREKVASRPNRT